MSHKILGTSLVVVLALAAAPSFAERVKMELLKPTDGPCLYLLDDEGNETTTVANAPCVANGMVVNPGDPATVPGAASREAAPASPRDAASGMPTGRR